jgi:hypothetical protein
MPTLAALKANAAEAFPLSQFADRDFKDPGCWIKFQKRLIRWTRITVPQRRAKLILEADSEPWDFRRPVRL